MKYVETKQSNLQISTADKVVVSTEGGNITVSSVSKEELEGLTEKITNIEEEIDELVKSIFEDPLEGLDNLDMFQDTSMSSYIKTYTHEYIHVLTC